MQHLISMNVLKEQMAVLRHAMTQLPATPAPVIQAIVWQVTDMLAMVNYYIMHTQFDLMHDHLLPDINECQEGTDGCAQMCDNTIGSYTCDCHTGFRLNSDSRNCNGKFAHYV